MTDSGSDVIVIGGGPAGVAAALELRRAGASVTLLDREATLGGATRHCSHSPFGMREFGRVYLGPAYARRLEMWRAPPASTSAPATPSPPCTRTDRCPSRTPPAR